MPKAPETVDQQIYMELKSMNQILSAIAQRLGELSATANQVLTELKNKQTKPQ